MDRKTFIKKTAGALLLAAPAYAIISCSSSDDSGNNNNNNDNNNNNGDCLANGAGAGFITNNHGHELTVPSGDVTAGVEKIYDIDGISDHGHMVTITAANFITLANNQQVIVGSTLGAGHQHAVTVICA